MQEPESAKKLGQLPQRRIEELVEISSRQRYARRMRRIMKEFQAGFKFLEKYQGKTATIFGSARDTMDPELYEQATDLAYRLSKEGYIIITGGGPGIMEAANKGANEAGGHSLGIDIKLPKLTQERKNPYVTDSQAFYYFFTRKLMLAFSSQVYIFFPGGFGTLDEFFELTTLVQTKKIKPLPMILVDKKYWQPLFDWVNTTLVKDYKTVSPENMEIYALVDTAQEAFDLICNDEK